MRHGFDVRADPAFVEQGKPSPKAGVVGKDAPGSPELVPTMELCLLMPKKAREEHFAAGAFLYPA